MTLPDTYTAEEKKIIEQKFNNLLQVWDTAHDEGDIMIVTEAFKLAAEAHKDARRNSGEPYIYHPLEVATVVAQEMDLGKTSITCALLHDVVEDTNYTLDDMEQLFGKSVRTIIDGLTKIDKIAIPENESMQALNFKKVVSTMLFDIRVVLIKIADRLHNMRTLDSMPYHKKLRISSETMFLYSPLAYRLGLYAIKCELEDLSLKYTNEKIYNEIKLKQKNDKAKHEAALKEFYAPIERDLKSLGMKVRFEIEERSVNDVFIRMKEKEITFDEVYDTYVLRLIIDCDFDMEKIECWKAYAVLTSHYYPSNTRLRDWISFPKANGYSSLHAQMMSSNGNWVEVQIRTERMNIIAEKGLLGYWNKGGLQNDNGFDSWIDQVRSIMTNNTYSTADFIDDFKLNLFADEIFVFTPKGKIISLPKNATVLDFAYAIHSELGNHCNGAYVNHKLVEVNHVLQHGDQIDIITSENQHPQEQWFEFLLTANAKSHLKDGIKEFRKTFRDKGKAMFLEMMKKINIEPSAGNKKLILNNKQLPSTTDLYYFIANERITIDTLKVIFKSGTSSTDLVSHILFWKKKKNEDNESNKSMNIDYIVAPCCNPIPGDDVVAFSFPDQPLQVHRTNCPKANVMMANYGRNIVKAKWRLEGNVEFLAGIKITGADIKGFGIEIMTTISKELDMNARSVQMSSEGGIATAIVMVYVHNIDNLNELINKIKLLPLVKKVTRIDRLSNMEFDTNKA